MQKLRLGKRTKPRYAPVKELVPLAELSDLVFGGWDIFPDNTYEAAVKGRRSPQEMLSAVRGELEVRPADARGLRARMGQEPRRPQRQEGAHQAAPRRRAREGHRGLPQVFGRVARRDGLVRVDRGLRAAEAGPRNAAGLREGARAELAGHSAVDDLRLRRDRRRSSLRQRRAEPFRRRSGALGDGPGEGRPDRRQGLQDRTDADEDDHRAGIEGADAGAQGWFSTNILGNRDGEVLDDPGSFRSKEVSKASVLDAILQPELYPELYRDYFHKVRIEYYPPRGDAKEGWDNIDIVGWLGQPMQIKIDFLCRDSILAAPVVLDLLLFLDLAARAGLSGIQEWLSFYFKSPMSRPDLKPEHDLFVQHLKLANTLRILVGEEVLDHSGLDYYEGGRVAPHPYPLPRRGRGN
jgi:myo-inositol-1-phosphate synthase